MFYQNDLLATKDENESKYKYQLEQLTFLPINPLQEKHANEDPTLTEVEFQIIDMTLKGYEITDIQEKIFRTTFCVKWRLSQIYWKFGAANRLQLIKKACEKGLQFYTSNGIKMSFHMSLNMLAHLKDENKNETI